MIFWVRLQLTPFKLQRNCQISACVQPHNKKSNIEILSSVPKKEEIFDFYLQNRFLLKNEISS